MKLLSKLKFVLLGSILSFGAVATINSNNVIQTSAEGESVTTVTDVITADKLAAVGRNYVLFSNLSLSTASKAKYTGYTNKQNASSTYIQFTKSASGGIFSSVSGGKIKSLVVNYPISTNGAELNIFVSESPYSGLSDLYDKNALSFKTIDLSVSETPTEKDAIFSNETIFDENSFRYIGFASAGTAVQIDSISITWESASFGTLDSIEVVDPGNTSFVVGETYSAGDISVIKKDTDGNQENISVSDIKTDLDGHVFTEEDVPSIKNKVTYNGKTSEEFDVQVSSLPTFKKVTSKKEDWTGTYLITATKTDSTIISMDSSSSSLGAKGDYVAVTENNGEIKARLTMAFSISKIDGTSYSIKTSNGQYIYCGSNSNNDISTKAEPMPVTIDYNESIAIKSGDATLAYNKSSSSDSFKFFQNLSTNSLPITLYEYQAPISDSLTAWANQINDTLTCDNGINAPSVETWNDIKSNYFDSKITGVDLETIRSETGNPNGTTLQKALAKYDYIVSKYGDSIYSNYLDRNVSINLAKVVNKLSIPSSSLITLVSILSVGSCVGIFLIIKRRKGTNY